jgi:hypothetical protein
LVEGIKVQMTAEQEAFHRAAGAGDGGEVTTEELQR